jgi:multidrug transporter EmrE-like cation transporter
MTSATVSIIVLGVLLNAAAQLLLKVGVSPLGPLSVGVGDALPTMIRVLSQWPVLLGLACYVVSVGVWVVALSRVDVSVAYPMLSLGYVVNVAAAWWLLGEAVGPARIAGVVLILAGVWLVARS